jgi:murein DD-endopeptidase MepM/ murein hydrolase activator NlpD
MLQRSISTCALIATFLLSGCAELFLQPYGHVAPDALNVSVGPVVLPEGAPTIAQGFNPQRSDGSEPIPGGGHEGIDIYAERGTPVIAPASGIVKASYSEPLYGNQIVIDHGRDKNGRLILSKLLHLNTRLVKKGDAVIRGQKIGTLGSTGLLASYPHLHFEIRLGENSGPRWSSPDTPHKYWMDGTGRVTCFEKEKNYPDVPFKTTYPVPCR